jgi:hypothetical protein
VLDDIRRGAPPPRGKDRGLTVSHLNTFLDPRIWKTFEGDGENVLRLFLPFLNPSPCVTSRRASSPFTETFSLDWRTTSPSGLHSSKRTSLVSETTNPCGTNPKMAPKSVYSTRRGLNSPRRKISRGSINGIFQMLQTAGQEGSCGNTCLYIFPDWAVGLWKKRTGKPGRMPARSIMIP